MILQLTVPKDSTISFEVGIASFEVEPSKAEVPETSFTQVSQFAKTSNDEEEIYTFSLTDLTDENKPFVALSIQNINPVSYFTILVKNNEPKKGIKVYNLAFNHQVVFQQEGDIETPLYFNVTLNEPITQKKISFDIKVKKDELKSPVCSISGYDGYPDFQDFSKNLIEEYTDSEPELSQKEDYDVNKFSVDNIEGAKFLIIRIL